ncbi:hypothetical protein BD779DRAFT_927366 [Infundibulicybe gibba]|nr:hypothetical protein BD779DRAFT_927366 [Infundibulicybe gibba]
MVYGRVLKPSCFVVERGLMVTGFAFASSPAGPGLARAARKKHQKQLVLKVEASRLHMHELCPQLHLLLDIHNSAEVQGGTSGSPGLVRHVLELEAHWLARLKSFEL